MDQFLFLRSFLSPKQNDRRFKEIEVKNEKKKKKISENSTQFDEHLSV